MEMELKDELGVTGERLAAAAGLLEQAVERLAQRQSDSEESIGRIGHIVATVEARRESELEEKLAAAEAEGAHRGRVHVRDPALAVHEGELWRDLEERVDAGAGSTDRALRLDGAAVVLRGRRRRRER